MGAVWMRLRADLRERWRSWLGLALLAGLAGGLVTAAAAGARRTDTAYERMLQISSPSDVFVYNYPDPGLAVLEPDAIEALPQVADAARVNLFYASVGPGVAAAAPADDRFGTRIDRTRIIAGRRADLGAADEVTVSSAGADEHGLDVGSTFPSIPPLGPDDPPELKEFREIALRSGLPLEFRVVGVHVGPGALPPISTGSSLVVIGTPALHEVLSRIDFGDSHVDSVVVRLKRGAADVPSFLDRLERLAGDRGYIQPLLQSESAASVERAIGPLATALWLLAGLLGVAGLLVLGQAVARQIVLSSDDDGTLRAIGLTPGQMWAVLLGRAAVIGAAAAIISVIIAVALSPLAPVGIAGVAEPQPGLRIDAAALGVGGAAVVFAVAALTALPAWRASTAVRRAGSGNAAVVAARPSPTGALLARAGAPTSVVAGAHLALTPGRGTTSVPVRATLFGMAVAVAALAAALGIGASFDHLLRTPRVYGQTWDRFITNYGEGDFTEGAHALKNDPGIEALSYGDGESIEIEGKAIEGKAIEAVALTPLHGALYPPVVEGRVPSASDEIALGVRTLRALGARVGGRVDVSFEGRNRPMVVVGRVVMPAPTSGELGEQALLDYEANLSLLGQGEPGASIVIVRFARGADVLQVLRRVELALIPPGIREFVDIEDVALPPKAPTDVVNFGRVENLPLVLGGALGVLAAAVLAHMIMSSVRRRRRDLAILKTLGLGRRGVRAAVGWQATMLVLAALVVGIPLGVVGGRWAWTALADRVGILPAPRVPVVALLLLVPAGVLLANLVAAIPGRIAARTQPALVLRSE